jgi:hypothetical protein
MTMTSHEPVDCADEGARDGDRQQAAPATGAAEPAGPGGGLFIGGSMTGGAIATGRDSVARDSGRRAADVPLKDLPAPADAAPRPLPGQAFIAGHVTGGALAAGEGSQAVHEAVSTDAGYRQLFEAVVLLRQHLEDFAPSPAVTGIRSELAAVQDEITDTGRAEQGRLSRLRDRLSMAAPAIAALTSAVSVAKAIKELVNG